MGYLRVAATATALVAGMIAVSGFAGPGSDKKSQPDFFEYVSKEGDIRVPEDVRTRFVHLGSFFVPNEPGAPGAGLHDVYTQPITVEVYRETGRFPDGAVLVKEVRHATSAAMTTGNAHWGADIAVQFVMVRDRNGRFSDHPNFGGGWGWGLFEAGDRNENIADSWKGEGFSNCFGCHVPAKETDWVYVQGYPALR